MIRFRRLFTGPRWQVRKATYLSMGLIFVAYITMTVYTGYINYLDVRSFLYSMIFVFEAVGAVNIRRGQPYWPAYKFEKILGAMGFAGLSASTGVGLVGNTVTAAAWFTVIIVAKVIAFEFILSKNVDMDSHALNSAVGKISPPLTTDEADQIMTIASAYFRHGFGSAFAREEFKEAATKYTDISEWAKGQYDYLKRRREKAAYLQSLGLDVEARDLDEEDVEV